MKASNQKIIDQDEVTAVSVNRSLLSVDYASMSARYLEGLTLTHIQRTSKFPTTSKEMSGSRSPRLVPPNYPPSPTHHR